tara:strand:+ start:7093 stop:7884 length:792 start_codon:yes stop_codon:yes gene_type:complete
MGLPLAIAIGAGFGGISALARGESNRNVLKSMLTGAAFSAVGGYGLQSLGVGTAGVPLSNAGMLTTKTALGVGTAGGMLGDTLSASKPKTGDMLASASPYSDQEYTDAYARARGDLSGLTDRAQYADAAAGQDQSVYNFTSPMYQLKEGGIAELIPHYAEGGVNYLPSKMTHDENDVTNYTRATGYVEDGSGNGDKDEDTMLAQLADGEFVSRADAVLGAGIMAGASPKDFKDARRRGAAFFYKQQDQLKRIYDITNDNNQTS